MYRVREIETPNDLHIMNLKSVVITYTASVLSATNAELFTYPLDLIKTRLQIQGENATSQIVKIQNRLGFIQTGKSVITEEGFFKLWSGITPAICRHAIYSGTRLMLYEQIRDEFKQLNNGTPLNLYQLTVSGVIAGCIAQYMANPAELVKVQMMMEGRRKLMGEQARFNGTINAFKTIYNDGGVRGLWKGCVPSVQRAALVTVGDISCYDISKRYLLSHTQLNDNFITHFIASFTAGFISALLCTPADVIKSRVMNQPTDKTGRGLYYTGTIDCIRKTITNEGAGALYKGFFPLWLRLGPWSLVFWITFEQLRNMTGSDHF